MSKKILSTEYWNDLYKSNDIGWDIGFPSPPIKDYIDQLKNKDWKILIPGCGNAYEAEYLLSQGFTNVTLIDFAPMVTAKLEQRFERELGIRVHVITGDFFKHEDKYQLILEQTFLSALEPSQRTSYAEKMRSLLVKGGQLVGVLFNERFEEGPPFGGSVQEYKDLFGNYFSIKSMAACYNSIERREGSEVFINLTAR